MHEHPPAVAPHEPGAPEMSPSPCPLAPLDANALQALMAGRRSIRRFRPELPPRALIEQVVAAAITAPSASNKQPWRFCVVTDRGRIVAMREAVQAALDRVLAALPDPLARREIEAYGRYFVRFEDAPVVIAPMYRPLAVLSHLLGTTPLGDDDAGDDTALGPRVRRLEQCSGLVSTSLALQNLLLSAHTLGLGASCMTGPLLAAPEIEALLGMRGDWRLACLVPLGHPDEAPEAPRRKSAAAVLRWYESPDPA